MIDKAKMLAMLKSAKLKKYVLRAVIAFALIGVLGFLVLPPVVKYFVLAKASEALHRTVAVEKIRINPYALSLEVEGLSIKEPDGAETFASFDSLYVNLESASIFRGGPVIGEFRLVAPKVRIARLSDKRYNFSDLMDEFMAQPKSEGPTPAFSVNNIQLTGGEVVFDDQSVGEKHLVSDINLGLPFISSLAYATEIFVEPAFSATFNGSPLVIKGRSKPFSQSLESEMTLDLADLELDRFLDYSPIKLPIKMLSGKLDTQLTAVFRQEPEKAATLEVSGTLGIKELNVKENSGASLLSFKQLDVAIAPSDLLGGRYAVEKVTLASPEIHARVSKDGDINWIEFFRGELAKGAPVEAAAGGEKAANPATAKGKVSWSLAQAKVSGGAVHWLDESHGEPFNAKVDNIDVDLRKLSNGNKPAEVDLSWRIDAGEWLTVERFAVKGGQIDLAKREAVIPEIETQGARSLIKRTKDGAIDWLKPPSLRAVEASQQDASAPWTLTINKYHGDDIGLRFEDGGVSPAVTQSIENLSLDLENVTTVPGQVTKVATNFKLNKKGEVALSGSVQPFPLVTDIKLDVKGLEILPFQPYFAEKLNVDVTRGQVAVSGDLQLRQVDAAKTDEAPALAGGFAGQATIGDFSAVDKLNSADFLRWKSFYFGKIDAKLNPNSVSIGEVALSDFFARVIVTPEGKLNLMQIVRQPDGEAVAVVPDAAAASNPESVAASPAPAVEGKAEVPVEKAAASEPMMPVKIGKITLQGGAVRFTDNFVKPNYTANLRKIGGSVTGLSSEPGSIADLTLRGSYDDVAPLSLTAKINPLSAKPYLDLQAEVKGIEMTSFSTYSGKYAGYAIDKGKLSVFVNYKIENDQLNAENRVFLDQLTFGDQVESPDATKLPVKLAIALLKNGKGEIDINLPISGSLNDPQFSIGGLVVKMIVNLFVKAVTSPFALIGSMFGGGEELSNVEFAPGRATIDAEAQKRLENLSKALIDRPALKLEIEGRVDPENDPEGLKHARIERKVRAAKREDMTKEGVEVESLSSVQVSDEEYPALLERVYRAEKFPKPRNMVGLVKTLPVEEMEKLMLTNSTVDEEDLTDLGDRRAKAVRDWLIEHQVDGDRIFLRPTQPVASEVKTDVPDEKKAKAARADFSLK